MKTGGMVLKTAVMVIVPLLLLVSILGAPFAKVYATGTVLGIESAEDVEAGSVFISSIYLENAIMTTGIGLDLTWDPLVLTLLEVTIDPLGPEGSSFLVPPNIDNIEGSMTLGLVNTQFPDYITVIENTPILDLKFEAIGSPGDSTMLHLMNVELSDEEFIPYYPDVVDGYVSIYTPEIISIYVNPSDIDFGKIYAGDSGTSSATIINDGNVEVSVTATLGSEVPIGFYTSNFKLDGLAVSVWSIPTLGLGASEPVGLSLDIPVGTEPGFKTAILTFWAETP